MFKVILIIFNEDTLSVAEKVLILFLVGAFMLWLQICQECQQAFGGI